MKTLYRFPCCRCGVLVRKLVAALVRARSYAGCLAVVLSLVAPPVARAAETVTLALAPFQTNVLAGVATNVTSTLTVTIAGGSTAVNLALSGAPAGVTAGLSASSFTASATPTLTVTVADTVAPGVYPIVITASGGASSTTAYGLMVGGWTGASGTDTNWSDGANWSGGTGTGGVPGATDSAVFSDLGTATASTAISNVVDSTSGAFAGTVAALRYANGSGFQNTLIASGVTLNVGGGLVVGTAGDPSATLTPTATIAGAGGALNLNNASAVLAVNQGTAFGGSGMKAFLVMSNLDNFTANLSRVGLGSTAFPNPGNGNQRDAGVWYLAKTNLITLNYAVPLATYQAANATNAIELSRNPGNNAGTMSMLFLGQTNALFVDSLGVGRDKASATSAGWLGFNPVFTNGNPAAYFRGTGGASSRVTWWAVGDMNNNASSAQVSVGTNDFSNGTIDALVNVMSLGRDCAPSHTASGSVVGVLTFNSGTIDVNTLYAGNQSLGPATSSTPEVGIVNVTGANATLVVNSNLVLGRTTQNSSAATNTSGTLNLRDGTVRANAISVGAVNLNSTVTLSNGTLVLAGTVASPAKGLTTLNITNSTLTLNVGTATNIVVTNLVTGGATNVINPASVALFAAYPAQATLIKYAGAAIGGVGYNFGLGANPLPGSAPGAYLSNNVANKSIDLYLPLNPAPVITSQPQPYSGNPGDAVVFSVTNTGNVPLSYQWYYATGAATNALADGAGPSGSSTVAGAATGALTLGNAQPSDSGGYFVIVTNLYGAATSTVAQLVISSGAVAPSVTGPSAQTVIDGHNTAIVDTVSGSPLPTLYWYFNGALLADGPGPSGSSTLSGTSSSTLTLSNARYPGDQGTYSLVASNSAGLATNGTVLTVIVSPGISAPPQSLVVTSAQPASLSVTATGVPAPTYQWFKNGGAVSPLVNPSATNATFTISSAAPSDIASYYVQVSNAAGTTNSASVTLTVNSLMAIASLTPSNGASGICYDTPLYVTFDRAPLLRNGGLIRIYNAANPATPVDTLDMSQNVNNGNPGPNNNAINVQPYAIGGESFTNFPVIITGNAAAIYPHHGVLTSNQTYYVTIDDGVFTDTTGAYFTGIAAPAVWQFATKPAGPANPTNLVVAQDYSGDFATVQGAVDSVPANNTTPTMISIHDGVYTEIVVVRSKNNILVRGQSRHGTILGYANNSNMYGSTHNRMAFHVNANDIAVDNLTVTNMTPLGGSQAEAIMIESNARRFILNNCDLDSYQDTLLANQSTSVGYFNNSLIQGSVDFIWGGGNLFFTNCEVRWLTAGGEGPNPSPSGADIGMNGFSFVNCSLTTLPAATGCLVGRTRSITNGNTALITCLISSNISGWASDALPTNNYRNWYYSCSNATATANVTLNNGIPLDASDPNVPLASSAVLWLNGWVPQLSPNIIAQPDSQTVIAGHSAALSITATGIPDPAYQWSHYGTNLPGATSATLGLADAQASDDGPYSVVVSNAARSVTSSTVMLTVNPNTPPVFTSPPAGTNYTMNVGVTISVANVATDSDGDTITYSLQQGPVDGALDTNTGVFLWRPTVSQGNSSNNVTVIATDSDSLTATNTFSVTVNPVTAPGISSPAVLGGQFSLAVTGQNGPDYAVQASTNVADSAAWATVFRTNSPGTQFQWTDPDTGTHPLRFYRIIVGPPLP